MAEPGGGGAIEFSVIHSADEEEDAHGHGGEDQLFGSIGGPVPMAVADGSHGGGVNHQHAEAEQGEDAEAENIAVAKSVDGVGHV